MLSCLVVVVRGVDALGFVVILLLYSYVSSFNAICFCFVVMVRLHCVLRRISLSCRASWMVCMVYFGLPSAVDACSWRLLGFLNEFGMALNLCSSWPYILLSW